MGALLRKNDARRGNQVFSGELLLRGKTGAAGSDARHLRSWLPQLHPGQIADFEVARRLQSPARRRFLSAKIPQRAAQSRYATDSSPSRNHAQRPEQMGPGAVISFGALLCAPAGIMPAEARSSTRRDARLPHRQYACATIASPRNFLAITRKFSSQLLGRISSKPHNRVRAFLY